MPHVSNRQSTGGIVATAMNNSLISNVYFGGSVVGRYSAVGGVVGRLTSSTIEDSSSSAIVISYRTRGNDWGGGDAGGIVGGAWGNHEEGFSTVRNNTALNTFIQADRVARRIIGDDSTFIAYGNTALTTIHTNGGVDFGFERGHDTRNGADVEPTSTPRETLRSIIVQAEARIQANYTPVSWARMQSMLTFARNVYNNPTATEAQINDAINRLRDALDALVPR